MRARARDRPNHKREPCGFSNEIYHHTTPWKALPAKTSPSRRDMTCGSCVLTSIPYWALFLKRPRCPAVAPFVHLAALQIIWFIEAILHPGFRVACGIQTVRTLSRTYVCVRGAASCITRQSELRRQCKRSRVGKRLESGFSVSLQLRYCGLQVTATMLVQS